MEAILHRELITNRLVCRIIGVGFFVIATMFGAFVRLPLPFTPVPLTLQTFFVISSGLLLGGLGSISQISYLILGVSGLPVFAASTSGLSYLSGPTGGYLLGFVVATAFLARFIRLAKGLFGVFILACLADLIILSVGTLWLKIILGYSIQKAFFLGLVPFIPGDLFKAFAAATLYLKLKPRLKEIF